MKKVTTIFSALVFLNTSVFASPYPIFPVPGKNICGSYANYYIDYDAVFIAKVVNVEEDNDFVDGTSKYKISKLSFEVEKIYKGNPDQIQQQEVLVYPASRYTSNWFEESSGGPVELFANENYLIYASLEDNNFRTIWHKSPWCSKIKKVIDAKDDINVIEDILAGKDSGKVIFKGIYSNRDVAYKWEFIDSNLKASFVLNDKDKNK